MLKRLNALSIKAYIRGSAMARELKNGGKRFLDDERGISGVVVAVMLILVAVLAVALLWDYLGNWLETLWSNITNESSLGGKSPKTFP